MVLFISGCDSDDFLEKIGLKEKITKVIQTRNEIAYLPNSEEPFTGKYQTYYSNGQKESETNFKDGKENGLATEWHENGQKESNTNYKDGKRNGLTTVWNENGVKESETTYKDGQINGLAIQWYENGNKESEITRKLSM